MPTTVTYTVDTGGTGDYTSLSAWEAAQQQDLATNDILMQVRVTASGGAADTTACGISGWVTDATRYIDIAPVSGQEHAGIWDDAIYRIATSNTDAPITITSSGTAMFVQIRGLQIETTGSGLYTVRQFNGSADTIGIVIEKCIIRSSATTLISRRRPATVGTILVRNNLCIVTTGTGRGWFGGTAGGTDDTAYLDNNTFVCNTTSTSGVGIVAFGNTIARNNIVNAFFEAYSATFTAGTDYNATDLNETPGTGSNNLVSQSFSFVDSGAGNYRLTNSLAGVDLSGTFTDDIIETVRPQGGEFDIGCFERLASRRRHLIVVN